MIFFHKEMIYKETLEYNTKLSLNKTKSCITKSKRNMKKYNIRLKWQSSLLKASTTQVHINVVRFAPVPVIAPDSHKQLQQISSGTTMQFTSCLQFVVICVSELQRKLQSAWSQNTQCLSSRGLEDVSVHKALVPCSIARLRTNSWRARVNCLSND